MQRLRRSIVGLFAAIALLAAIPAQAAGSSCNCWDGGMICTIWDDDGNITGWMHIENHSSC